MTRGDEFVSSCQTVFVGGGRAETGIGTREAYRRQGFGLIAACSYIDYCIEVGVRPEWWCFYNQASGSLAEKLGFTDRREVQVNYIRVVKSGT